MVKQQKKKKGRKQNMALSSRFEVIGTYFKDKRIKSGVSQTELARELGFSTSQMISNWERGICSPPMNAVAIMVDLFRLNKKEVITMLVNEHKREIETELRGRKSA